MKIPNDVFRLILEYAVGCPECGHVNHCDTFSCAMDGYSQVDHFIPGQNIGDCSTKQNHNSGAYINGRRVIVIILIGRSPTVNHCKAFFVL